MRLPIALGAILLAFLSLNTPVMSQSLVQVAQKPENNNSNLKRLEMNRQKWDLQRIDNYRYTLSNHCFCPSEVRGPVIIEVRNGVTISIKNAETGQPVNSQPLQEYSTIPKLFDLIQNAINSGESVLSVKYDRKLGYPTEMTIGDIRVDAGIITTVSNLQEI
ncbi:hypothetical protein H6G06_21165 [Anabaena sphaerica FACHB-251]|uniref:Uncharacterized protein n=1 Tax=Anabaena sphaerica FACHB-251 TaxID=2692883 RepID=A0A926WKZ3_9NOST|nr:DUF6174 domain-containing protein [Anabaena sphaerica]MBD2295915.1 hypothetical protein [Anabaena sphaerica FACHB-251]